MDIPEATHGLKPGGRHVFHTREDADKKLNDEQKGPPEQDGVLVEYRGKNIRSDEVTTPDSPKWFLAWVCTHVFGFRKTLKEALDAIDEHLDKGEDEAGT